MEAKIIDKYSRKIYPWIFLAFLAGSILSIVNLLNVFYLAKGNVENLLTWPGSQILPLIMYKRGILQQDFLVKALSETPYVHTANILEKILPISHSNLIASFVLLTSYARGFNKLLTVLAVGTTVVLGTKSFKLKTTNLFSIFAFLFFIYLIPSGFNYINLILDGHRLGWWGLPICKSFYPCGISNLFGLLALLGSLIIACNWIGSKYRYRVLLYLPGISFYLIALYLHPIIPLFVILISAIIRITCIRTNKVSNEWNLLILFYILSWLLYAIAINTLYGSAQPIDGLELFNIYVRDSHPYHYLPSYYINEVTVQRLLLNMLVMLTCVLTVSNIRHHRRIVYLFSISSITCALFITICQYIGVELLHNQLMVKLGISRLSPSYNFLYLCTITSTIVSIFQYYRENKIISKINLCFISAFNYLLIKIKAIFIISILTFSIISGICYSMILSGFDQAPSFKMSRAIQELGIDSRTEFLFLGKTSKTFRLPREIGHLNVYTDYYFPFNPAYLNEWQSRQDKSVILEQCLFLNRASNEIDSPDCSLVKEMKPDLIIVSDESLEGINLLSKINIEESPVYLYDLNSLENNQ